MQAKRRAIETIDLTGDDSPRRAIETIDLTGDDSPRRATETAPATAAFPAPRARIPWPGKTVGHGIFVAPSRLAGAGNGLFAAVHFERGDVITFYDGPRITRAEAREPGRVVTHIASIDTHAAIDGLREPFDGCGGGSFINDPRHRSQRIYNARLVRTDIENRRTRIPAGIHVEATTKIAPGDEIFAYYGRRGFERAMQRFGAAFV
jgi:hypothetical protein